MRIWRVENVICNFKVRIKEVEKFVKFKQNEIDVVFKKLKDKICILI